MWVPPQFGTKDARPPSPLLEQTHAPSQTRLPASSDTNYFSSDYYSANGRRESQPKRPLAPEVHPAQPKGARRVPTQESPCSVTRLDWCTEERIAPLLALPPDYKSTGT
jgi:hypothetical protein